MEYQWWVLSLSSVFSGRIGKVFYHNKPMFGGVDVDGGRVWHYDLFEFWGSLTAGGHSEDEWSNNCRNESHYAHKQAPGNLPVAQGDVDGVDRHPNDDTNG